MTEMQEFNPGWEGMTIKPGRYIFQVAVKTCLFRDTEKEKPYMQITFKVLTGTQKGFDFENRIYISKKAEWRVRFFLKKFDYPAQLLEATSPILKKPAIEGLQGKVLAIFEEDNYGMLKCDVKAFDHLEGTEIEEKEAKIADNAEQLQLPATDGEPALPARDVMADVKQNPPNVDDDLSALD